MAYDRINPYQYSEAELRNIWSETYCQNPIFTFDGFEVRFYSDMFDHCFYESANRQQRDKSILSYNRLEKIFWIKEALEDPASIRKVGWDSKNRSYDDSRRVTLVKGNYIVVIALYGNNRARFITAYEVEVARNLKKILDSPDWV